MEPTNNKSLLHFIFGQMKKLDEGTIDVSEAKAQAHLAKQANNALKYELDRVTTIMKIDRHNREFNTAVGLRNAEGKGFE